MKKSILNLGTALSKAEQQSINGSGGYGMTELCAHLCPGVGIIAGSYIFETTCDCN